MTDKELIEKVARRLGWHYSKGPDLDYRCSRGDEK